MMNCSHCNTHIDEHPASRCLDAWVAEVVMGWLRQNITIGGEETEVLMHPTIFREYNQYPHYSTSIAAAWEVVEKLTEGKEGFDITRFKDKMYHAEFAIGLGWWGHGDTAPLAICRAAIKATCTEPT